MDEKQQESQLIQLIVRRVPKEPYHPNKVFRQYLCIAFPESNEDDFVVGNSPEECKIAWINREARRQKDYLTQIVCIKEIQEVAENQKSPLSNLMKGIGREEKNETTRKFDIKRVI